MNDSKSRPMISLRLRRALCLLMAGLLALAWLPLRVGRASGRANMSLAASPEVILADGQSVTTLTATVRDGAGALASDGITVRFTTSLGTLDRDTVTTTAGVARVRLTSASSPGTATITATSFLPGDGSSTGSAAVEFTADRDSVYSTGSARWIHLDCPQDVLYSADGRIAEAHGKHGSAHLHYHGLDVNADALQVNLQSATLLAHNATLVRGRHTLEAIEIEYDLGSGAGIAVVRGTGRHAVQSVAVSGYTLHAVPLSAQAADATVQTNIFRFADISDAHVLITARGIEANPGDQIQFRRASIYSDGKRVVSMPFHVMSMNTQELFGQQLFGFGTQGFFVNVPIYYHVSPGSTGTLFLRNSAVAGSSSLGISRGGLGNNGTRPGLALDLQQTYTFGRGGSGTLLMDGLTRADWGAHWNHTQRLDDATNSYFFVDYPAHRSLYASSNVSRQFRGFSLNMSASGSRDPGFSGYSSSNETLSAYVQSTPRQIGQSGINMVTDLTVQQGQLVQTTPTLGRRTTAVSTRGVDLRFFTAPLHPDRHTNLTNSLTVGQSWGGSGKSSPTVLGTLSLSRTMGGLGSLSANYTYRYDPLFSQLGASSSSRSGDPFGALYRSATQQRLTVGYSVVPTSRLSLSLFGGYGLPLRDSNLFASLNYRVSPDWGLGLNTYYDHYAFSSYHETELSVSRRLFGRDLVFTYSTLTKKLRFDLAASGL